MFKVIIAGGRDFNHWNNDNSYLYRIDNLLSDKYENEIEMVTGGAKGADQIPYYYKTWHGYKLTEFPADWDKHGKSAGYIRNKQMAEYADALIAFWDSVSKGTKHMIDLARHYKLKVKVINY